MFCGPAIEALRGNELEKRDSFTVKVRHTLGDGAVNVMANEVNLIEAAVIDKAKLSSLCDQTALWNHICVFTI